MRGEVQETADLLEGVPMPDLQDNDLALFGRKRLEAALGGFLGGVRRFGRLKPSFRFQFSLKPPPQPPAVVHRPVAESP